ncbi:synaptotagmin-like protein 3 isoform X1 [Lagopus muta]|uniref:synaptotagmin-like protein 3 isoform X1 n=1 Tax=Lagopus muta TaxID=64668 RepID=UPI00209CCB1C|nr:synaptotagmin-like protein 3 isoform X1 [Lagopus muta]XP_048793167.1 synaptotagmin-like protein 3 isoform X1 [Lagopus muta]XP_048793168.1 synaptotagmin-like protein 3 isoform X1 [Lagopus muta]XP_048793169.1 synaptotagmin-like protein 3 isoform X1 [Lagopus muta]XP_048793170.1 synaptotagmin-like protein 3 isoform X1 [Lagopus muta]XP_048793171.1 synaptotagmin-like protein 3 isoform X1 [Lagopus muta]XP_048793172.1 synaptotagmin-like protein 3 isoform X1 [Lagopus muta]XP_048793173.1 synaptotag
MACEFNLNFLKELEREAVLEVLYRDQMVRKTEEERVRKLKMQLHQLRWKGARNVSQEYRERSCARCQKSLGLLLNRGAVCNGCSHRVCSECRVCLNPSLWKCTVCYAHGDVKVKAGEWFFEERAKKYPDEGRHETAGAKLLKSYQKLSKISVVPPTPPPYTESTAGSNAKELGQSKSFNKSVENLFLSLTTHIKKISKSQNDMADRSLLTTDYGHNVERRKQRRSQSDTAINITSRKKSTPSLQDLFYGAQNDNDILTKRNCKQEEDITTSPTSDAVFCDGRKHGSLYSLNSTCTESGNFGKANVTGEIEFAIRYIFKACILEICIRGCKNLAYGEERKKKCNPYVKVYLLPDKSSRNKRKTAVKKNTVDPEFDETLKYKIERSQLGSRQLQISVWHAGALKYRVFLGEVVIPLAAWSFEDSSMGSFNWYQLQSKHEKPEDNLIQYSGELLVSARLSVPAQYKNFQFGRWMMEGKKDQEFSNCQLQVMIFGARNLPVLRSAGTLNSFVKGCLLLSDQAELKQKSPVVKKEDCPQWKHLFVFDVTPAQLQQSCLHLTVWDQSTFGSRDQFLGGVKLGAKQLLGFADPISPSVLQWEEVLRRPNTWMDFTLILHSNMENFKS